MRDLAGKYVVYQEDDDREGGVSNYESSFLKQRSKELLSMPIRLTQTPTKCSGMRPVSRIKLGKSWRFRATCQSKQGAEGVEWVEAPVEPERKLVEVGL